MNYKNQKPPTKSFPTQIILKGGEVVDGMAEVVTTDLRRVEFLLTDGKVELKNSLGMTIRIDPNKISVASIRDGDKLIHGTDYQI